MVKCAVNIWHATHAEHDEHVMAAGACWVCTKRACFITIMCETACRQTTCRVSSAAEDTDAEPAPATQAHVHHCAVSDSAKAQKAPPQQSRCTLVSRHAPTLPFPSPAAGCHALLAIYNCMQMHAAWTVACTCCCLHVPIYCKYQP
jgi:hypothetical protein